MKKIFVILVPVASLFISSCKKYHTCECTTTVGGVSTTVSVKSEEKLSKKEAKKACERETTVPGGGTVKCSLK